MLSHRSVLAFQRHLLLCPSLGYTMKAAGSCETLVHFYWTKWHYMPYYLQSARHYLLKNQGISCINPTVRGTKIVAIIETGQHIKQRVITDTISNSLTHVRLIVNIKFLLILTTTTSVNNTCLHICKSLSCQCYWSHGLIIK